MKYLPDFTRDSSKHCLKSLTNGAISSSNSSLVKCSFKSSSSKSDSQLISASLFPVKSFLIFSMESRSLSLALLFSLGSQPYFFSNFPPKSSVRYKSIYLAPKFLFECVPRIFILPGLKLA